MWRRGTQFDWVGANVPGTRGGRRSHPPKGVGKEKKVNKKEVIIAFNSALSATASPDYIIKRYKTISKIENPASVIESLSNIDSFNHSVTDIPQDSFITPKLDAWTIGIETYLDLNQLDINTFMKETNIKKEEFLKLPSSLPYSVIQETSGFSTLDDFPSLRYQTLFKLINPQDGSVVMDSGALNLSELAGSEISLSFIPATASDQTELSKHTSSTELPAYLIHLTSELEIKGLQTFNSMTELPMGTAYELLIDFIHPDGTTETEIREVIAGSFYSLTFNLQNITESMLETAKEDLKTSKGSNNSKDILNDTLHLTGLTYFFQMDELNRLSAGSLNVSLSKEPSLVMASYMISIDEVLGLPHSAQAEGIYLNTVRDVLIPISIDGTLESENKLMMTSGITTSVLTSSVLDNLFGGESLSTARLIEQANTLGMEIYTADNATVSSVIDNLTVSKAVEDSLEDYTNSGFKVSIPKSPINYGGYTESGFAALNPNTGESSFFLESGLTGSKTSLNYLIPVELLQFSGSSTNYHALGEPPLDALSLITQTKENMALSYLPAQASVSDWLKDTSTLNEVTTVASILSMIGPISNASIETVISSVTHHNSFFSPQATLNPCSGVNFNPLPNQCTGFEFSVSQDSSWTLEILNNKDQIVYSKTSTQNPAQVTWDGKDTNGIVQVDGVYEYSITSDTASEIGTITIDTLTPTLNVTYPTQNLSLPDHIRASQVVQPRHRRGTGPEEPRNLIKRIPAPHPVFLRRRQFQPLPGLQHKRCGQLVGQRNIAHPDLIALRDTPERIPHAHRMHTGTACALGAAVMTHGCRGLTAETGGHKKDG